MGDEPVWRRGQGGIKDILNASTHMQDEGISNHGVGNIHSSNQKLERRFRIDTRQTSTIKGRRRVRLFDIHIQIDSRCRGSKITWDSYGRSNIFSGVIQSRMQNAATLQLPRIWTLFCSMHQQNQMWEMCPRSQHVIKE